MIITIKRTYRKPDYTIGDLYINGAWFCNTLEDTDRYLNQSQTVEHILNIKRFGDTAIPAGRYKLTIDIVSNKFASREKYKCIGGKMPRVLDIKGFDGILIHPGNTNADTKGCILVGKNRLPGRVTESVDTFFKLYEELKKEKDNLILVIF